MNLGTRGLKGKHGGLGDEDSFVATCYSFARTGAVSHPRSNEHEVQPHMAGRKLHLVRHGAVKVDLNLESSEWGLAPDAAPAILELSHKLVGRGFRRIVASTHRKATETAGILADALDLGVDVRAGLEEHHRSKAQLSPSQEAFHAGMLRFFAQPGEVVVGTESAEAALGRFREAITGIMAETEDDELIVSHGAVISLLAAAAGNGRAEDLWQSLRMPDHLEFDWPSLSLAGHRT